MGIKSTVAESWTRDLIYVISCLILHKNAYCWYSKESSRRDDSLEYQQLIFYSGEREIIENVHKKCAYREYCYRVTIDGFSWSQA